MGPRATLNFIVDAYTERPDILNCYCPFQVSGQRAYEVGFAIREIVDSSPEPFRVAVVGSGGFWHSQGYGPAYLDEAYDQSVLGYVRDGDAKGMPGCFDCYAQEIVETEARRNPTKMPPASGPQDGTRETCNWIAATAAGGGVRSEIVDYVPVYASPIGVSFTYSL